MAFYTPPFLCNQFSFPPVPIPNFVIFSIPILFSWTYIPILPFPNSTLHSGPVDILQTCLQITWKIKPEGTNRNARDVNRLQILFQVLPLLRKQNQKKIIQKNVEVI